MEGGLSQLMASKEAQGLLADQREHRPVRATLSHNGHCTPGTAMDSEN